MVMEILKLSLIILLQFFNEELWTDTCSQIHRGTNFKKRDPFLTSERKKIPCREVCMVRENPHHRIWRYILDRYQYWATTGPHACFPQSGETYSVTATRTKEQVKLMSIFCALLSQTNIWSPLRLSLFKDKKFIFGTQSSSLFGTLQ